MPTMPTSTSCWNLRAAPPSFVKIATPFAYGLRLTSAIASAYVATRVIASTGPKISSL